jgi:hypothetical protein
VATLREDLERVRPERFSGLKIHAAQQVGEARVRAQRIECWIDFNTSKTHSKRSHDRAMGRNAASNIQNRDPAMSDTYNHLH